MMQPDLVQALREREPLVHCICNIVAANDCANLLLAAGARAIMAQEPAEMEDIVTVSAATVLNTGTPDDKKFEACLRAGAAANRAGHPVVLDPVGAGVSAYRRERLRQLLETVHPTIIRCNFAEAEALLGLSAEQSGVEGRAPGVRRGRECALRLARRQKCTVLLTGTEDVVTDGMRSFAVRGGSARMRRITGAGCMLSALTGAFAAVSAEALPAAVQASVFWKSCCAAACRQAQQNGGGLGAVHALLFDMAERLPLPLLSADADWEEITE